VAGSIPRTVPISASPPLAMTCTRSAWPTAETAVTSTPGRQHKAEEVPMRRARTPSTDGATRSTASASPREKEGVSIACTSHLLATAPHGARARWPLESADRAGRPDRSGREDGSGSAALQDEEQELGKQFW